MKLLSKGSDRRMCCELCSHESSCLMTVPVFKGMKDQDIQALRKVTKSRKFKKGEYIFGEGDRSETLFVVKEGLIKLTENFFRREGTDCSASVSRGFFRFYIRY